MNNNRSEERKNPTQELREPAARRGDDRNVQREHRVDRAPSKIERRDWRGDGVCGDRHTD